MLWTHSWRGRTAAANGCAAISTNRRQADRARPVLRALVAAGERKTERDGQCAKRKDEIDAARTSHPLEVPRDIVRMVRSTVRRRRDAARVEIPFAAHQRSEGDGNSKDAQPDQQFSLGQGIPLVPPDVKSFRGRSNEMQVGGHARPWSTM